MVRTLTKYNVILSIELAVSAETETDAIEFIKRRFKTGGLLTTIVIKKGSSVSKEIGKQEKPIQMVCCRTCEIEKPVGMFYMRDYGTRIYKDCIACFNNKYRKPKKG